jgi:MFS family permease
LIRGAESIKSDEYGRLTYILQVSVASATLFTGFSIGTALAPNLASFFVFRILTAFQGTAFLVIGSAVIGDIYKPVSNFSIIITLRRTYMGFCYAVPWSIRGSEKIQGMGV